MGDDIKLILVTGSNGFIGQHLCKRLLTQGYKVRALTRIEGSVEVNSNKNLEVLACPVLNLKNLEMACENVDVVIHLAGLAHDSNVSSEQLYEANVGLTETLLSAAVKQKVKRVVLMSSSLAAYVAPSEKDCLNYSQSKLAAEKLVASVHATGQLEGVILRPVNVYGPGMRGNIATLMTLISKRLVLPLPRLDSRISLIGVFDLCDATTLAGISKNAPGKTYIVTDGKKYKINEIEEEIYRALGRKMPPIRVPRYMLFVLIVLLSYIVKLLSFFRLCPRFLGGVSIKAYNKLIESNLFESRKIQSELGFKPKYNFHNSLPKILGTKDG